MNLFREALTSAWGKAQENNPEVKRRTMVFGGAPEDEFVYVQLDGQQVFRFALGRKPDQFTKPSILEVGNMGMGRVMSSIGEDAEQTKTLMGWWKDGLKQYLLEVKSVRNASLLPEELKSYLIDLL